MKRPTHCQRILDLLSDGLPHSHLELYALGTVAHSRISDLRKRGYVIEQRRDGDLYLYRLLSELSLCESESPTGDDHVGGASAGSDSQSEVATRDIGGIASTPEASLDPRRGAGMVAGESPARPRCAHETPAPSALTLFGEQPVRRPAWA